eukprot:CAMPEP_0175053354 /NCGR_PEP_ID=MMETSP0052_2-20121109/8875_1 /TAXON_ID=51329 ORGANISM="Polytomella parva, Strain SAG 63-3" /NCGR_SAMPLE_ID=MMETSP0052_2 /ASSEMBLY_ACC=CAM_ASM_000194 /LENGTH=96 /DNA_ID=CAMNT_0016317873 /DNA_START=91 /DNA_END=378 /DNA_ORIENTATION=-
MAPTPKIIICGGVCLEKGPARKLLTHLAPDPKNLLAFLDRAENGTLAHQIQSLPYMGVADEVRIQVLMGRRQELSAAEVEEVDRRREEVVKWATRV